MLLAAVDVKGRNLPPWPEDFGVELVTAQPGQALLFSESMQHSTYPCARTTLCCMLDAPAACSGS